VKGKARPFVRRDKSQKWTNEASRPRLSAVVAQLAATRDEPEPVGRESRLGDALAGLVQSGSVDVREAYRRAADRAGFLALLKRLGMDTALIERAG